MNDARIPITAPVFQYDYAASSEILQNAKTSYELSRSNENRLILEVQRKSFLERFLPDLKFWSQWIDERIAVTTTDSAELSSLDDLFETALSNCASVELANQWTENLLHRHEAELVDDNFAQITLEKILGICGMDIMDGASLWTRLAEVQKDIVEDLSSLATHESEIRSAKEVLVSTYRRQFALPLLGNKRSLSNFDKVLSEICIESDELWIQPAMLIEKFQRSEQQLQSRILFENNVLSDEFLSSTLDDQVAAWKTYIRFEIDDKQLLRAQRLYERGLITSHQSVDLWSDYADFAENTVKQWSLVESVTSRAVKVHRGNVNFWLLNLLAIESNIENSSFDSKSAPLTSSLASRHSTAAPRSSAEGQQMISSTIKTALASSFQTADDYLAILLYACDSTRRRLKQLMTAATLTPSATLNNLLRDNISLLRDSFRDAEMFLDEFYAEWCSGWLQVYKYQTSVEDETITEIAELLEAEEPTSSSDPNSSGTEPLVSLASDVWERAVLRFAKYHYIWNEYIQWSRSAGDYELCRSLYHRALKAVRDLPEEVCKSYLSFEQQVGSIDDLYSAKGRTRSVLRNAAGKALRAAAAAKAESKARALKRSISKATHSAMTPYTASNENETEIEMGTASHYTAPKSDTTESSSFPSAGQKRTYEDHLPTGTDTLTATESTTKSNNIAPSSSDKENSREEDRKRIKTDHANERTVSNIVKPAVGTKVTTQLDSATTACIVNVKNLSFNSTIEEVRSHFDQCGTIIAGHLVLSKAGKSRGQALLEFSERSEAEKALKLTGSLLGSRAVVVDEATAASADVMTSSGTAAPVSHHPTTVFVSKFSAELTSSGLRDLFAVCGGVMEARVIVDKRTGLSKCHGLVQFFDEAGKAAALDLNKKNISGHVLSVLPSKFGAVAEATGHYGPSNPKSDRGGGTAGERVGSDVPPDSVPPASKVKSTLSFRPRKIVLQTKT